MTRRWSICESERRRDRRVIFDRAVTRAAVDDGLGHRTYSLEKLLQPGDSLELRFDVRYEQRGFSNDGVDATPRR